MPKQVCDVKPGKGMTTSQSNEHLRVASKGAYAQNLSNNFDPSREHLNFEVTKGGRIVDVNKNESIPFRIRRNLKKRKIKDPNAEFRNKKEREANGRRTIANIVLYGDRSRMRELAFGDQKLNLEYGADNSHITCREDFKKWAVDMYNFIADKYGEDNIAAFVAHLDETTPHIHCTLLTIPKEGQAFSYNKVMGGSKNDGRMSELHNELAEINAKWGLERGDKVSKTGARHRTTAEYKEWLEGFIDDMREEKKRLKQNVSSYEDEKNPEIKKKIGENDEEIRKLEKKEKSLRTMISNLENKLSQMDPGDPEYNEIMEKIQTRKEQLDETSEKLKRLVDSSHEVNQKIEQIDRSISDAQQQLQRMEKSAAERTLNDMKSRALDFITMGDVRKERCEDLDNLLSSLKPLWKDFYDEAFGGSVAEALIRFPEEVARVSTLLFLNYIDAAVSFAQSHGGGGGSPSGGWGRDKDDDDDAWRRKCFFMGMHMMRPSAGRRASIKTSSMKRK